jgi:uncharacterized protein YjaZ
MTYFTAIPPLSRRSENRGLSLTRRDPLDWAVYSARGFINEAARRAKMKFNIIDTQSIYRRMLAAPDAAEREAIFRAELTAPFEGLVQIFGGGDPAAMFKQWAMSPDQFGDDRREAAAELLDRLAAYDAWNKAAQALEEGRAAFAAYADRIPLDIVRFALMVADMRGMAGQRGYTGFGGIPGYIMTVYSDANDYTLPRLEGATVHELHHNILGAAFPESPMIASLGAYMVGEGLAESFAAELYGEEVVGFYVTDFDEAEIETARRIIGGALDVTGFNAIRGYIFGDMIAEDRGLPKAGVPAFTGYGIGYRVVQQYLKRTGKTVPEATFVPAKQIIAESGFFDNLA